MYGRGVWRREKQCLTATEWSDAVYGVPWCRQGVCCGPRTYAYHTCVDGMEARHYGRASSIRNLRNSFQEATQTPVGGSNAETCHIPVVQV